MERQCQALCRRWAEAGAEIEVWTRHIAPGSPAVETLDGIRVRRLRPGGIGRWGEYGSLPVFARRLVRDRQNYDVATVFGSGWLALAAGLGAQRAGRPWLLRPATAGDITRFLDPAATPAGGPLRRRLRGNMPPVSWRAGVLRRCDAVVAISDEIAEELARWKFPASRIALIPNGVDTDRYRPADQAARARLRIELELPPDAVIVLFLGRLVARKGMLDLAQAWRLAKEDPVQPPACLVIAGSGAGQQDSVEGDLEFQAVRSDPTIRLAGPVSAPAAWLAASDVFVLPSHREGLSNALLEAMAVGLRIVASDLPPTHAAVHGLPGAWLFPPGNVPELAAGLRAAIAAARTGSAELALRDRAVAAYSLDRAAGSYQALFQQLSRETGR